MGVLHAAARKALPSKSFALPSERKYPIEDRSHAANAKARASGKPEQRQVDAAVARKYPDMGKKKPTGEHAARLAHALRAR